MRVPRLVPSAILALPLGAQDVDHAFFEREVLPRLETHCFECHGPGPDVEAGLRLTSPERLLAGGDTGPAVDLERPGASLLLEMLSYDSELHRMPPSGKLPDEDLEVFRRWIEGGAPWSPDVAIEVEEEREQRLTKGDGREGWSYRPVVRPEAPAVRDGGWVANPVDAFVLARLEAAGLAPAPRAGKRVLLRRVAHDLTGLPPSPEDYDAFLADDSGGAWDRVIERLLASPRYGERWGRHWLDLMRYAETNGYERDSDKPFIWRYRDYVIDAFNRDLPYDRFVVEQLAGDELEDPTPEAVIATGYTRLMLWDDEPGNGLEQARYDVLDDLVRSTSEGFLGMTMGCARCHDHKGDPIETEEYYSFLAFFDGLEDIRKEGTLVDVSSPEEQARHARAVEEYEAELARLHDDIAALERTYRRRAWAGGVASGLSDLTYRFYRDTWSELPDFDRLRPEDEGELPGNLFDLSPATRETSYGFVFEGRLAVPATGSYRFTLDSDDGARLAIGGDVVVERDGAHGLGDPEVGVTRLEAGSHPVRLDYFQGRGGAALDVAWEPVDADTWRTTTEDPGEGWSEPGFDDAAWPRGPGGFGTADVPGARVGTEWSTPDLWLRRRFEWSEGDGDDLVLVLHHNEDVEVRLNGVPAYSREGYEADYTVVEVGEKARATVRPGTNLLAVHCRNEQGGQYVHARPVHRADVQGNSLADLAFGRRALSARGGPEAGRDLAREIEQQGDRHLSRQELVRWRQLRGQRDRLKRQGPPEPARLAFAATSLGPNPPPTHVHVRGNAQVLGERAEPGLPACLDPPPLEITPPSDGESPGRRLALARWIASPDHPLTARVMVNRIWQHHLGRGLVASANDFGELGERPTHPELLDWLAAEFVDRGWSVKEMHRLILRSATYRMGWRPADARTAEVDPENTLHWRHRMRRLSAEEVRDSILWLTGRLNPEMGGPSFYSMISEEARATSSTPDEVWSTSTEAERLRRSVYIKVKRSLRTPLLVAFDLADTDTSCPERFTTTQPAQALSLLNGAFANRRAADVARRLREERPGDPEAQLARLLELALGRPADDAALEELLAFRGELLDEFELDPDRALTHCCLLVVNLNEFVYLD